MFITRLSIAVHSHSGAFVVLTMVMLHTSTQGQALEMTRVACKLDNRQATQSRHPVAQQIEAHVM